MDSVKKLPETDPNEQIEWLKVCTQFSESYLKSLNSHELNKLYQERVVDR